MAFLASFASSETLFRQADRMLDFDRYLQLRSDPLVVSDRFHLVRMDRSEIFRSIEHDMPLVLNAFNDAEFRAHVERVKDLEGGSTFISGSLEGGGHITIFLHGSGIVRGEIHSIRGVYALRSEGKDFDQVLIKQVDLSDVVLCGNDEASGLAGGWDAASSRGKWRDLPTPLSRTDGRARSLAVPGWGRTQESARASAQTDDETIDVLVVYTQRVEDHEGGPAQVQATIENEVAKMNQILENSGLSHRQIRLAAMEKVDYVQSSRGIPGDLANLERTVEDNRNNKDYSALDEVYELREEYEADLVHLIVRDMRGQAGMALRYDLYLENFIKEYRCQASLDSEICLARESKKEWKNRSYSVSSVKAATSGYVFSHELGHNMGLYHARADSNWDYPNAEEDLPLRPYAFGYVSPDFSQRICQLTVMSTRGCPNDGMDWATQVPYFSNPGIFFPRPGGQYASRPFKEDTPMGVPGDEYTIDLDGPVNASKAIDDVWDIVTSLSDLDSETSTVNTCNEGDIASDALTSGLDGAVELPAGGGTETVALSFAVPDNCAGVSVAASSASVSVTKLAEGEFELSITAAPHDAFCRSRTVHVTVELQGVSGVSPATIAVRQEANNALCAIISDSPDDSASLDLSGRNSFPSFRLTHGMFARLAQLESLNLSRNLLADFLPAAFYGLDQLKDLNLSVNAFTHLPESAFSSLPTLETLNLSRNRIRSIDASAFDLMPDEVSQLKTLDLGYNQLGELEDFVFEELINLTSLQLNNNQLAALNQYMLSGMMELKQLNLGHNDIETVHASAFSDNSKLTHLRLHANEIVSLPEGVFSSLTELKLLNLSHNRFEEFPSVFSDLSNLRVVTVSQNDLTTLPANAFEHNTELTHLYLSGNDISSLPSGAFSGLAKLRSLSLAKNELTAVPDVSGLSRLLNLWLYTNRIGVLPSNAFSDLSSLRNLHLLKNEISSIESDAFAGLSRLTHLRLSENKLAALAPAAFEGLPNVVYLTLQANDLTALPDDVFSGMPKLGRLWLHSNEIRTIEPDAFAGLTELEYLNISKNPLEGPLPESVCEFIEGVETVDSDGVDIAALCSD